jgi:hypothetical protein
MESLHQLKYYRRFSVRQRSLASFRSAAPVFEIEKVLLWPLRLEERQPTPKLFNLGGLPQH